jgi:hypothetical protein
MKKIFILFMLMAFGFSINANAQMSATKDAQYLAVLTAVVNYKINDEEHVRNIEKLRQDERFNRDVQDMLDKLTNKRSKNTTNRKVLQILEKAGREIYNLLD